MVQRKRIIFGNDYYNQLWHGTIPGTRRWTPHGIQHLTMFGVESSRHFGVGSPKSKGIDAPGRFLDFLTGAWNDDAG